MINFDKITTEQQQELMATIQKNVEKSELDRFYLFTINPIEKAKLYVWCCRFIIGIVNVLEEGNLKNILREEAINQQDLYYEVNSLLTKIERTFLNKNKNLAKIQQIVVEDRRVDEIIDAFAILLEKQNILSMSRIKGIVLDGNSGKEFKKVFSGPVSETQNLELETSPEEEEASEPVEPSGEEVQEELPPEKAVAVEEEEEPPEEDEADEAEIPEPEGEIVEEIDDNREES